MKRDIPQFQPSPESWWATPMSREDFSARRRREQSRMNGSRFAQIQSLTLGQNTDGLNEDRWRKARRDALAKDIDTRTA